MDADPGLYAAVKGALEASRPTGMKQRVLGDVVNASADRWVARARPVCLLRTVADV
jgi:hypothetical protein